MTTCELQTISAKVKSMAKSMWKNVMKEAFRKQSEGGDVLDIGTKDSGAYLTSERVSRLRSMLQQRNDANSFRREEKLDIRGSLILQPFFTNAKRAGDIGNLTVAEVASAAETIDEKDDEDSVVELNIVTHKEARIGKTC